MCVGHAAFLVRPKLTLVREVQPPKPQEDEVLVRLEGCGICASNLSVWEGRPWFAYPREPGSPGHEGWGIVARTGPLVKDLEIGQRVAMLSGHAYAEFDIASRDRVVALPEELDDEPFLADSFGRALSLFERSGIRSGHVIAIIGDGLIELLLAQLGADAGAHVVLLSDRDDVLDLAHSMDAEDTLKITLDGDDVHRALRLNAGRGFDCVIELSGAQRPLALAAAIVADSACLVTDADPCNGLARLGTQCWEDREVRVINAQDRSLKHRIADVEKALQAALLGRLDPFPLLTHRVPLSSLDRGFRLLRERPEGFIKALMVNAMAA